MEEVSNVNNAESTSAEPSVDRAKDTGTAVNLMAQGKRNMICGEIPLAVNQFQDACQLLSKHYGEMAKECAEAYFCYGQALLDLARMETGVLGNALQGVDVEDEEAAEDKETEDEQFESANKLQGDEREKLRDEVYDAMADDTKIKKEGDSLNEKTEDMDESKNEGKIANNQNVSEKQQKNLEKITDSKEEAMEDEISEHKNSVKSSIDNNNGFHTIEDNKELAVMDKHDIVPEDKKEPVAENVKDPTTVKDKKDPSTNDKNLEGKKELVTEDKNSVAEDKKDCTKKAVDEKEDLAAEENKDLAAEENKDLAAEENKDLAAEEKKNLAAEEKKDLAAEEKKDLAAEEKKDLASEDEKDLASEDEKDLAVEDEKDLAVEDKKDLAVEDKKDLAVEDKKVLAAEDKKDLAAEDKKDLAAENVIDNVSGVKMDNANNNSKLCLKNEKDSLEDCKDEDKENTMGTIEDYNLKTETADVEMTEDKGPDEKTDKAEADGEGGEEDGEEEEAEDGEGEEAEDGVEEEAEDGEEEEAEDGDEKTDEEDPDDVSNLQLAWEMLELAKMIYLKESTKESQLRAAQSHLKLGEVGLETEQYEQAISDFKDCLHLQEKHLEPEDRLLAESHYQLGLAYSFIKQYEESIQHFIAAVKTIESKIAKLEETIESPSEEQKKDGEFDDPVTRAKQEISDLKEILPDIRAKIEDTEEEQKSLDQLKEITKEVLSGKILEGESTNFGSTSSKSNPEKASDISHLIRKKRKPEEDPEPDSEAKKSRQEIGKGGDALTINNGESLLSETKDKEATTEEAMTTS